MRCGRGESGGCGRGLQLEVEAHGAGLALVQTATEEEAPVEVGSEGVGSLYDSGDVLAEKKSRPGWRRW